MKKKISKKIKNIKTINKITKTKKTTENLLIGINEYIDFPTWKLFSVKAKIDTGAKTSSIHVKNIKLLSGGRVEFELCSTAGKIGPKSRIRCPINRMARVKSSQGEYSQRVFVVTDIVIGKIKKTIEVNLIDRSSMSYPMLLGRNGLGKNIFVSALQKYLLTKRHKETK